jgi:hypothetical protein
MNKTSGGASNPRAAVLEAYAMTTMPTIAIFCRAGHAGHLPRDSAGVQHNGKSLEGQDRELLRKSRLQFLVRQKVVFL